MEETPIPAADLARKAREGLSRYRHQPNALVQMDGTLDDVETTPDGEAWIVVRPVDGMNPHDFASATVDDPSPAVDQVLESIGKGGRISLVGLATAGSDAIARVRMHEVHTGNGIPVGQRRDGQSAPETDG